MKAIINRSLKNPMKGGEGQMKAHIYKIISVAAILTLLMGFVPAVAFAADSAATGSFGCTNANPTVTSITLQQSDKATETASMTPLTTYYVQIVAGDGNTVNDITQIDIWIFRDDNAGDNGTPGVWDADHDAIYRWVKSGDVWSMQNGTNVTTWGITTGSCDKPGDMTGTSGEWNLNFTVGKLAQEADGSTAEWDIKVLLTDAQAGTGSLTIYSKSMGAYAALSLSAGAADFGNIALGGNASIQTPESHFVTLQAIANDAFALGVKSGSTWSNSGILANLDDNGDPASTYFSLTADNADGGDGHPAVAQYVTAATLNITGLDAVARTSTSAGANEATTDTDMYMDCILGPSGLIYGTYSGTITYTITNS